MTLRPPILRIDRAELDGTTLVLRAVPEALRQARRYGATPLAYLFETGRESDPTVDLRLDAGHYDGTNLVWSFSGEVDGIVGLTEPLTTGTDPAVEGGPT